MIAKNFSMSGWPYLNEGVPDFIRSAPTQPAPTATATTPRSVWFPRQVQEVIKAKTPTPSELYPWASTPDAAGHIHYFLTNPTNFVNDVLKAYNAQTTAELKANYAAAISNWMMELNAVDSALLHQKFAEIDTHKLGQFAGFIWPAINNYFYVLWGQRDMNGFLNAHLTNIAKLPPENQTTAAEHLKELWSAHFPNFPEGYELTKENAVKYLELIEPEQFEEIKVAQAALNAKQTMTKFMGIAILGVFGLFFAQKLLEGKR